MKITTLLFILAFSSQLFAQSKEDIQDIRKYYYSLKEKIKDTEAHSGEHEYIQFYVVRIQENIHGKSYPGVGNYKGTSEKWFQSTKDGLRFGLSGDLVYKKSNFDIATRRLFSEYVFKDNKLIFAFFKTMGNEYRYYFKEEKLIKFSEKKGEEDQGSYYTEKDWEFILKRAKD